MRASEDLIAADIAARIGLGGAADLRPERRVCLAATEQWLTGGGVEDLPAFVDDALAQLEAPRAPRR